MQKEKHHRKEIHLQNWKEEGLRKDWKREIGRSYNNVSSY